MQGRVDLHRWSEEREVANPHETHVEHDAVEIEEHPLAEFDVNPVVAKKRRLHPHRVAALAEQVAQNATTLCFVHLARGIELLAEITCPLPSGNELGVERVVHLAREHLLAFSGHEQNVSPAGAAR
jgi:hypothetical protein